MEQHTNDSSSSLLHRGGNSSQYPAWLILLALTSISFSCSCGVLFPRVRCLTLWPARSAGRYTSGRLFRRRSPHKANTDRKRVVWGKRVSVRVDLGGRRTIKKKKQ